MGAFANWKNRALKRFALALAKAADDEFERKLERAASPHHTISVLDAGRKTRLAALIAIAFSSFSLAGTSWLMFCVWWNLSELRDLRPKLGPEFDSLAAAAAVGRLDVVSIVLTFLGIIAALGVLYGWSAFRAAAVRAAVDEIENRLPEELKQYMGSNGAAAVGRALEDAELIARLQARFRVLGLEDADSDDVESVDSDPNFREEESQ